MTEPALDDVIRQIAAQLRRGEHVDLQSYIHRYPSLADPLQALYPALTLVEDSAARVRGGQVPGHPEPQSKATDASGHGDAGTCDVALHSTIPTQQRRV